MKTVSKKLLCLVLAVMLLVSAIPAAFATGEESLNEEDTVEGASALAASTECLHEGDTVEGISATCSEAGMKVVRCGDCGRIISSEAIDALGHELDEDGACTRYGCAYVEVEEEEEEEEEEETGAIAVTIYEVDLDNNAVQYDSLYVDVDAFASLDAMVDAIYDGQYSKYNYREFGDGTAMLQVWPVETVDGKAVYQLKIMYNNGTSDSKVIDIYEGEGILAAIKSAGVKISYKDHRLVGYLTNHTGSADSVINIYHTAEASMANRGVITIYADWEKNTDDNKNDYTYGNTGGLYGSEDDEVIYDAILMIYINGKTTSVAKKLTDLGAYTKDGKITRDEVQLAVQKYYYSTSNLNYYGLFTTKTWDNGDYDVDDAVYSIDLDPDKTTTVYVMVKNAKAYGSATADSTNPQTGDHITVAATTMALAAAALVTMTELKKRKMI